MSKSELHQQSSETSFNPVKQYMDEAGRHELLTKEDEVSLAKAIEAGVLAGEKLASSNGELSEEDKSSLSLAVEQGLEAKTAFINANLRLVVKWARVYQNRGLDLLDLIQEGNLGLMHAVELFEYRRGFKFSTYSSWWIRQSMTRALADKSRTVRLPVYMRELVINVGAFESEFFKRHGRRPSVEELAEQSGYSVSEVEKAKANSDDAISLSTPIGDGGIELADIVQDEADTEDEVLEALMQNEQLALIMSSYEQLLPAEQKIIAARYPLDGNEPATHAKIGKDLSLTGEKVKKIEKEALFKMRSLAHLGRIATQDELDELLGTA